MHEPNAIVDRVARDHAASQLRRFVDGAITNFELERDEPQTSDRAVREVYRYAWLLYSDFREATLDVPLRSDPVLSAILERCVAFLEGDHAYHFPFGVEALNGRPPHKA